PHHGIAVELFRAPGPFALLPMKGRRSSLVWCERDVEVPAYLGLDDDEFSHEIQRRFGDYRGRLRVSGPRWSYPLAFRRAETMTATRLALVGDAAHGIHPVAGQGFNLGLRDVATLAELVVEAKRGGGDVGAPALLARYERWRRFDCLTMAAATDGIVKLFSTPNRPLKLIRGLGLAAVGRVPPLKRLFMRHAMGILGDLPRLVAGRAL
ncbi:MAG: 2-octaprenyl-6-methoxyphenyl hydroxylase, partial [Alphaproteobacteria bacterium]|nr:2-octaprenyl-6-methoxyphenyl hydroxylase [Alphaproteobacteria bacterium]